MLQRTNCNQVLPTTWFARGAALLVYDVHLESAGSPGGRAHRGDGNQA